MRLIPVVLITVFSVLAVAKTETKNTQLLLDLTLRYREAKMVRMKMDRTVTSELTGTKNSYAGEIALAGKKFRLDQTTPEKNTAVYDGKTLWTVQFPPEDFKKAPPQVTKQQIKPGDGNAVLTSLLTQGKITDRFEIVASEKNATTATYELMPKKTDMNITKLKLKIELEKRLVRELTVWDEVGNESAFVFPEVLFFSTVEAKLFKYSPPKGAQVIQL